MGPTLDTPAMGEGDVELAAEDVACDADGHMSTETEETIVVAEERGNGGAASDNQEYSPSLNTDALGRAPIKTAPESGHCAPEQFTTDEPDRRRTGRRTPDTQTPSLPSPAANDPTPPKLPGSCGSSDSESTITASGTENTRSNVKIAAEEPILNMLGPPPQLPRPNPLSFLEPDSPDVTPESIRRSIEESTARWQSSRTTREFTSEPSKASTDSSAHIVFSQTELETTRSSSPEHGSPSPQPGLRHLNARRTPKGYGAPEMPRGPAIYPHIPLGALQPRLPAQPNRAKHLSRPDKLPPSGYQLLASTLSSGHPAFPLRPIYRRFETLGHRVLLHLQDELAELEEQLLRVDAADTHARRVQGCILPASRRGDSIASGELQWHRTDILGKIGYKLEQYSMFPHILRLFVRRQY